MRPPPALAPLRVLPPSIQPPSAMQLLPSSTQPPSALQGLNPSMQPPFALPHYIPTMQPPSTLPNILSVSPANSKGPATPPVVSPSRSHAKVQSDHSPTVLGRISVNFCFIDIARSHPMNKQDAVVMARFCLSESSGNTQSVEVGVKLRMEARLSAKSPRQFSSANGRCIVQDRR